MIRVRLSFCGKLLLDKVINILFLELENENGRF